MEPDKPPGRKREFDPTHDVQLRTAVESRPEATRTELAEAIAERLGRVFSKPVITRALRRLGFTRKKDALGGRNKGRTSRLHAKPGNGMLKQLEHLIFFDESGLNLSMTRAYARAPRGTRALGHVPIRRRERLGGLLNFYERNAG